MNSLTVKLIDWGWKYASVCVWKKADNIKHFQEMEISRLISHVKDNYSHIIQSDIVVYTMQN